MSHRGDHRPVVGTRRGPSGRALRLLPVVLIALVGSACGGGSKEPVAAADLLTCAGPPFSPRVFDGSADAAGGTGPVADALRSVLAMPELSGATDAGWRELGRSSDEVWFGAGEPPFLSGYVHLQQVGSAWTYAGFGSKCTVQPVVPGRSVARWGLDPEAATTGAATTSIDVIVNDSDCSGGVGPEGRLDEPKIAVTDATVSITFTTRPLGGNQTCPGHPPAHRRVDLPERLGARTLVDGGLFPAQPPCRVESGDCADEEPA